MDKYRIEYRLSRYEGTPGRKYIVQSLGGNYHEFEAADDTAAKIQAPAEWKKLLENARKAGLRSVGYVRLERIPDPSPVAVQWMPAAA